MEHEALKKWVHGKNGSYSIHFVGRTRIGDGPLIGELARPSRVNGLASRIRAAWEVIRGRSAAVR